MFNGILYSLNYILILVFILGIIFGLKKFLGRDGNYYSGLDEALISSKELELGPEKYEQYLKKLVGGITASIIARAEQGRPKDEQLHKLLVFIEKERKRMRGEG